MFNIFKHHYPKAVGTNLKHGARFLQALVFPDLCLNCRTLLNCQKTDPCTVQACFCTSCLSRGLLRFEPPFCPRCGHLFDTGDTHVCETCLKNPPQIRRVRAALAYQGLVPDIVPLFKYHARLSLARCFEPLMYEAFDAYFAKTGIHLILPIPLHPRKMRQRGFNQSYLLVRRLARMHHQAYGIPPLWQMDTTSLKRVRYTNPQTGLDIAVRKKNLKNAFEVTDPERVRGTRILLVDDVYTTGATCAEAARILLAAGAARVDVLVLARA
jgi:ComF family protein